MFEGIGEKPRHPRLLREEQSGGVSTACSAAFSPGPLGFLIIEQGGRIEISVLKPQSLWLGGANIEA